jgi:hypothetical protein
VDKEADDGASKPTETAPAAAEEGRRVGEVADDRKPDAQPSQPERDRAAEPSTEKFREVAAAPPAPKEEKKKLGPIDETLTLSEDRSKAEPRLLRPGKISDQPDSSEQERTAAIKSDVVAKSPDGAPGEGGGKVVARRSDARDRKQTAKDTASSSYAAPASKAKPSGERPVGKKTFRLIEGVWTDKDYRRDKEIPGVTLVRDSDLYKEAVAREPALKAFLDAFAPTETVIVVYKRTAYKITPPK